MGCPGCEWDPRKNAENWRRRRIRFEDACCIFDDPHRDEVPDDRDFDEDRWRVVGRVGVNILVVVYTERGGKPRIISARKTEPREEKDYYARLFMRRL